MDSVLAKSTGNTHLEVFIFVEPSQTQQKQEGFFWALVTRTQQQFFSINQDSVQLKRSGLV
jgi:hypothetical protein